MTTTTTATTTATHHFLGINWGAVSWGTTILIVLTLITIYFAARAVHEAVEGRREERRARTKQARSDALARLMDSAGEIAIYTAWGESQSMHFNTVPYRQALLKARAAHAESVGCPSLSAVHELADFDPPTGYNDPRKQPMLDVARRALKEIAAECQKTETAL